jgi:hypothetical protein
MRPVLGSVSSAALGGRCCASRKAPLARSVNGWERWAEWVGEEKYIELNKINYLSRNTFTISRNVASRVGKVAPKKRAKVGSPTALFRLLFSRSRLKPA